MSEAMAAEKIKKIPGGSSSFILMVGDEGAILAQMQKKRVVRRLFAQSPEAVHTRAFEEALASAPHASVTMLVDMMDQSYVRQTLPPVSSFSVGKIVKRRLDKDFSRNDIKGYLILDREKTGRRDWNYLMVSLANPALLQKWISFASERSNPFKGIGLVPLESQPFIAAISQTLHKSKDDKPLEWQILVSHHKVGGFRQVVLRNGKLVFTRMAQPIGESNPEVIAGNIEQEMINTQEYLKRMGLTDPTTLCVIILASSEIKAVLDPKNIKAGEFHFFTPDEMADRMGLVDAAFPEDHFGDVVISAFIGRRRKLTLALHTPYTSKLNMLSLYIKGVRATAALIALGIIGWMGMTFWDALGAQSDTADILTKQKGLKTQLETIKVQAKTLPKQIDMYTDITTLTKAFYKQRYDALVFVKTFTNALQDTALVQNYHWSISDTLLIKRDKDPRQILAEVDLRLTIPQQPHDQYIASAQDLISRFKTTFPEYDVTHSEIPGLLSDTKELRTNIDEHGSTPEGATSAVDTIKITVKGPQAQAGKNGH